jgi:hypothetical protein
MVRHARPAQVHPRRRRWHRLAGIVSPTPRTVHIDKFTIGQDLRESEPDSVMRTFVGVDLARGRTDQTVITHVRRK